MDKLNLQAIEKRRFTWGMIHRQIAMIYAAVLTDMMTDHEENRRDYKRIYGVPRGGLVPAVMLSHFLELPLVLTYSPKYAESILVVDDILETGETLQKYRDAGSECAVLVAKTQDNNILPRYVGELTRRTSEWIVFPWENDRSTFFNNTGGLYHGLRIKTNGRNDSV